MLSSMLRMLASTVYGGDRSSVGALHTQSSTTTAGPPGQPDHTAQPIGTPTVCPATLDELKLQVWHPHCFGSPAVLLEF